MGARLTEWPAPEPTDGDKIVGDYTDAPTIMPGFRSRIGLAVRAGAAKPDISTQEVLKRTLLAAKSVGYSIGPSRELFSKVIIEWPGWRAATSRTAPIKSHLQRVIFNALGLISHEGSLPSGTLLYPRLLAICDGELLKETASCPNL